MKRQIFEITYNDKTITKSTWNSSLDAIVKIVREIAKLKETVYNLVDSVSNKEGFNYVSGSRTWKATNGKIIVFQINKIA